MHNFGRGFAKGLVIGGYIPVAIGAVAVGYDAYLQWRRRSK